MKNILFLISFLFIFICINGQTESDLKPKIDISKIKNIAVMPVRGEVEDPLYLWNFFSLKVKSIIDGRIKVISSEQIMNDTSNINLGINKELTENINSFWNSNETDVNLLLKIGEQLKSDAIIFCNVFDVSSGLTNASYFTKQTKTKGKLRIQILYCNTKEIIWDKLIDFRIAMSMDNTTTVFESMAGWETYSGTPPPLVNAIMKGISKMPEEFPYKQVALTGSDRILFNTFKKRDLRLMDSTVLVHMDLLNKQDEDGNTLLHYCVKYKRKDFIDLFLKHGADINILNSEDLSPLFYAIFKNNHDIENYLLLKGADINVLDYYGNTVLMKACKYDKDTLVSYLISKGADINIKNEEGGNALMLAVKSGDIEIVGILISKEININEKDKHGNTALHLACARKNNGDEILKLLLLKKPDLNLVNDMGLTPLKIATQLNNTVISNLLINSGAK